MFASAQRLPDSSAARVGGRSGCSYNRIDHNIHSGEAGEFRHAPGAGSPAGRNQVRTGLQGGGIGYGKLTGPELGGQPFQGTDRAAGRHGGDPEPLPVPADDRQGGEAHGACRPEYSDTFHGR